MLLTCRCLATSRSSPCLTDVLSEDMVVPGHLVAADTVTISPG